MNKGIMAKGLLEKLARTVAPVSDAQLEEKLARTVDPLSDAQLDAVAGGMPSRTNSCTGGCADDSLD
ncbi:hypothetical protein [Archangium lansingense]|uniref:Uncharacterized protein n=1 Tax=Archangium lansingense TaxID=2995310 RepID=A0ABT3ZW04_9BACT|nr:hypothetical protein [Archangium lansinium]MCY1072892.1 hypothetical protein [Archangium lansinium]